MATITEKAKQRRRGFRHYALYALATIALLFVIAVVNERLGLGLSGSAIVMISVAIEILVHIATRKPLR